MLDKLQAGKRLFQTPGLPFHIVKPPTVSERLRTVFKKLDPTAASHAILGVMKAFLRYSDKFDDTDLELTYLTNRSAIEKAVNDWPKNIDEDAVYACLIEASDGDLDPTDEDSHITQEQWDSCIPATHDEIASLLDELMGEDDLDEGDPTKAAEQTKLSFAGRLKQKLGL
jgi:hypothetical protein